MGERNGYSWLILDAMFLTKARPFVDWLGLDKHITTIDEEEEDNDDIMPSIDINIDD
jgi:hypothetical protein